MGRAARSCRRRPAPRRGRSRPDFERRLILQFAGGLSPAVCQPHVFDAPSVFAKEDGHQSGHAQLVKGADKPHASRRSVRPLPQTSPPGPMPGRTPIRRHGLRVPTSATRGAGASFSVAPCGSGTLSGWLSFRASWSFLPFVRLQVTKWSIGSVPVVVAQGIAPPEGPALALRLDGMPRPSLRSLPAVIGPLVRPRAIPGSPLAPFHATRFRPSLRPAPVAV